MATTIEPTVAITTDTLRGDIANALQILEFGRDGLNTIAVAGVADRLRSALAKLDGEAPTTASRERPRTLNLTSVRRGDVAADLTDFGTDELQLNYWGTNVRACVFIPRRDLPRMAAFARGEEV